MDTITYIKELVTEIQGILGIIVLAGLALLFKMVRDFLMDQGKKIWKWISRPITFKDSINLNRYINDIMVELRTKINSDRAWVVEFSNGQHFSANNPIWRMSRTYEKCSEGVNYEHKKLQLVLVSTVFELVECFLTGETRTTGITKINCDICSNSCKRHSFLFDVEKMPHIAAKQMLIEQGVKVALKTNLTNTLGETIGIIGVDYCDDTSSTALAYEKELIETCKILSSYAEKISYKLANFKRQDK